MRTGTRKGRSATRYLELVDPQTGTRTWFAGTLTQAKKAANERGVQLFVDGLEVPVGVRRTHRNPMTGAAKAEALAYEAQSRELSGQPAGPQWAALSKLSDVMIARGQKDAYFDAELRGLKRARADAGARRQAMLAKETWMQRTLRSFGLRRNGRRVRRNSPAVRVSYGHRVNAADPTTREATKFYWGIPASQKIKWSDPAMFSDRANLVQIGKLLELHVSSTKRGETDNILRMAGKKGSCHLVYDPKTRGQRMYLLLDSKNRAKFKRLYASMKVAPVPFSKASRMAGGRHAADKPPPCGDVKVKMIGFVTHHLYRQRKRGDDVELVGGRPVGPGSDYDHEAGDEGGQRPILAVDATGRLWYCGGNYHLSVHGIQD